MTMNILPLSEENMNEAMELMHIIFKTKESDFDYPGKWMPASLHPETDESKKLYGDYCSFVNYYVGVDEQSGKVIGTTGIYTLKEDEKEAAWLAWFCVHPAFRGKKYGSALFDFIVAKAREMHKPYLRLYTSENEDLGNAMKLYEKRGFVITKKELHPDTGEELIYMQMKL